MDAQELRKKELKELEEMEAKLGDEIVASYLDVRIGKEKNVRKPRRLRKDMALLKTIIEEKTEAKLSTSKKNG